MNDAPLWNEGIAINVPEVVAELTRVFERYEEALVANNAAVLDELFWHSPLTVRYGVAENLVGIDAIRAYRTTVKPEGLARTLNNTLITTFGTDFGTAVTEFQRGANQPVGRQTQVWVRLSEGWRVVSAHVSLQAGATG